MTQRTDTELADALVELGIGEHVVYKVHGTVDYKMVFGESIKAKDFVNDWRVAGACMVELRKRGYSWLLASMPDGTAILTVSSPLPNYKEWAAQVVDGNDCRAIIEAFVEAKRPAEASPAGRESRPIDTPSAK